MIKLLKKTLDRYTEKNNLDYRYIIRYYNTPLPGFGGFVDCLVELYMIKDTKPTKVFSTTIKCKSNEVDEFVCVEIMSYLIDNKNGME